MITAYRWDSNWKITLIVLLTLMLLMRLGFWQLSRAEEKKVLQLTFEQHAVKQPLLADELTQLTETELPFRPVILQGHYQNSQTVLLDNQINQGKVGYQLLTPFVVQSGKIFLINRGWIAGYPDRHLPTVPNVNGAVSIVASIYIPLGKAVVLAQAKWPQAQSLVVQSVDIPKLSKHYDTEFYRYTLRLQQGYSGALNIDWPLINTAPEKHTGYAVQWFLMALALLGFWLYSSIRRDTD